MTAEIMSFGAERPDASRPQHATPAELITSSEVSRRVFADFMWRFVGDPSEFKRIAKHIPPVERRTIRGNIRYEEVEASGYTGLGSLVHVRINRQEKDLAARYFVVTGDLRTGVMEERRVVDVEHQSVRLSLQSHQLRTTLYLADDSNQDYPQEYWPSIRMTQQGFYYCPGFDRREEQMHDPGRLYAQCIGQVAMKSPHLHSVGRS